jgi:hypothetical protein
VDRAAHLNDLYRREHGRIALHIHLAMGGFFPVMLMYNAYQIWVFRARISALAAYH